MRPTRALFVAGLLSVFAAFPGCADSGLGTRVVSLIPGDSAGASSTSTSIAITNNAFTPATTTVPVASTVTWTWEGTNSHNVTFDDGVSSPVQATGTFQRTFPTAGTFPYHCIIHGVAMSGTVIVQ